MKKSIVIVGLLLIVSSSSAQVSDPILWVQTNGPTGGHTTSVAVDSQNNIYVSSQVAGFFRSTNRGDTWQAVNRGLRVLQGQELVSDGGQFIFATTYPAFNFVMRLKDIESGWEYLNPGAAVGSPEGTLSFGKLAANSKGYVFLTTSRNGILRTTDHGDTWHQVRLSDTNEKFFDLIRVGLNGDIYALTYQQKSPFYCYIFRSTDDGESFEKIPTPVPDGVFALTLAVAADGSLLVGTIDGLIHRSTDHGLTWDERVFEHPAKHDIKQIMLAKSNGALFATTHSRLTTDQTRTGGIFRSLGNGARGTWVLRDATEHGEDKFYMAENQSGDLFHVSVPAGVIKTTDQGITWSDKNNGVLAQFIRSIDVNSKGDIFAVTTSNMFRSTDGGDFWQPLIVQTREAFLDPFVYITSNDIVYHASAFGLYRSTDNGNTFNHVITEDSVTGANFITDVREAPFGHLFVASSIQDGRSAFLVSKDQGRTFDTVKNIYNNHPNVRIISIGTGSGDTVLAGADANYFFSSSNKGVNWSAYQGNNGCKRLVYHPLGLYIAVYNNHVDILDRSDPAEWSGNKIFPSGNVDTERIWGVFSVFVDRNGWVYVTTDSGIFRSTEFPFNQWKFVARGLTARDFRLDHFTNVSQLAQDRRNGMMYAASRGQSVYKGTMPDLSVRRGGSSAVRGQIECYPNPFNESTSIAFDNPKRQRVQVEITNPIGSVRRIVADEIFDSGEQLLTINASDLPSGAYICRIRFEDGTSISGLLHRVK